MTYTKCEVCETQYETRDPRWIWYTKAGRTHAYCSVVCMNGATRLRERSDY